MTKWKKAIKYNKDKGYGGDVTARIQREIGVEDDGHWGPYSCAALADWQLSRGLDDDGMAGPATRAALAELWHEVRELDRGAMLVLAAPTRRHESGGDPGAALRDGEFHGHADTPKRHPDTGAFLQPAERAAYRAKLHARDELAGSGHDAHWASQWDDEGRSRVGSHVGLSLGPQQVTQDGGALGSWLGILWREHRGLVEAHLGEHTRAIVRLARKDGRRRVVVADQGPGRRSPRVRQIAGADLWESPHVEHLQSLARTDEGQWAFDQVLIESYVEPVLDEAFALGLTSGGDLAVVVDFAVQFGAGGARDFLEAAARGRSALTVDELLEHVRRTHRRGAHHAARRRRIYNASPFWSTYTRPS